MWKVGKIPCLPPDSSPFLQTYKPNEGCFYDAKLRIPPIPCKFYLLFFDHCPSELSLFSSIRGLFSNIRGQSDSQAVQFFRQSSSAILSYLRSFPIIYTRARICAPCHTLQNVRDNAPFIAKNEHFFCQAYLPKDAKYAQDKP